jgi:hypothetical protein
MAGVTGTAATHPSPSLRLLHRVTPHAVALRSHRCRGAPYHHFPHHHHRLALTAANALVHVPPRKLPEQPNHRQPSTVQQRGTAQPGTTTEQPGAAPPPLKLKPLRWLNDQAPTGRPKAHDYDHDICRLIVKSCHEFSARVCTQEALPDPEMQINWSREIWEAACKVVDENYECSDRVIGLVSIQLYRVAIYPW